MWAITSTSPCAAAPAWPAGQRRRRSAPPRSSPARDLGQALERGARRDHPASAARQLAEHPARVRCAAAGRREPLRSASRSSGVSMSSASEGTSTTSGVEPRLRRRARCDAGGCPGPNDGRQRVRRREQQRVGARRRGGRARSAPSAPATGRAISCVELGRVEQRAVARHEQHALGARLDARARSRAARPRCGSRACPRRTIAPWPAAICWATGSALTTRIWSIERHRRSASSTSAEHRLGQRAAVAGLRAVGARRCLASSKRLTGRIATVVIRRESYSVARVARARARTRASRRPAGARPSAPSMRTSVCGTARGARSARRSTSPSITPVVERGDPVAPSGSTPRCA